MITDFWKGVAYKRWRLWRRKGRRLEERKTLTSGYVIGWSAHLKIWPQSDTHMTPRPFINCYIYNGAFLILKTSDQSQIYRKSGLIGTQAGAGASLLLRRRRPCRRRSRVAGKLPSFFHLKWAILPRPISISNLGLWTAKAQHKNGHVVARRLEEKKTI